MSKTYDHMTDLISPRVKIFNQAEFSLNPSLSLVSGVRERYLWRGALSGCPGWAWLLLPRGCTTQWAGWGKRKKTMFQSRANKGKASDVRKNIRSHRYRMCRQQPKSSNIINGWLSEPRNLASQDRILNRLTNLNVSLRWWTNLANTEQFLHVTWKASVSCMFVNKKHLKRGHVKGEELHKRPSN